VTVTAPPRIRALDAGPAAEPVTALKTSRPATLLEAMRRAHGSPIDAAMAPGLARDAARSGVDAIIVRTDDAVFFARNTPPPVQRRLVGTTGIIEALGGPPAARTVRFDGFGDAPQLVESIVRSTELARKAEAPDSTRLSRFTDMAAKLFHGSATARSGTEATIFSHSRPGAQPAILRVANMRPEAVGPLMKQPVAWRAASVGVGEVKTLESGRNATSTYVRFSSGSVPASGQRLGIEVQTDAGRAPVSPQSLATATRTTLLQAGGGSTPLVDGLLLLRESIGRQLKPAEINFFIGDGATPVRITLRRLDPLWGQGL
jgi:hypothetical protein